MSSRDSGRPRKAPSDGVVSLVLAVCHEVRNHLHGVGLHAGLLDESLTGRELAQTSLHLEDLSDRSAGLLDSLRPLLERPEPAAVDAAQLAAVLSSWAAAHGGRGVDLRVETLDDPAALPGSGLAVSVLQPLVASLIAYGLDSEARGPSRPEHVRIGLSATADGGALVISVEDDGPSDRPTREGDDKLAGRPLVCAVAKEILEASGGGLSIARTSETTRISLRLPPVSGS